MSRSRRAGDRKLLRGLIGVFILVASLYSVMVPPFETPDEIWHYAFIHHLASGQGLPISEPGTQALWQQQGVQAPGYYLLAAGLTAGIDQSDFPRLYARANPHRAIGRPDAVANRNYLIHHRDEGFPWQGAVLALHGARFLSILLGAVTLWATYRALVLIVPQRLALLGTAVVAFIPQFIFISAAASNDNMVNALAALALWRLVALITEADETGWGTGIRARPLRRDFLGLGMLLGLAILSKLSALGLVGLAGLTVLGIGWRRRDWRVLVSAAIWIGLPMLVIGGWWYWRNWQLYGDPLAWNVWQANILLRVEAATWSTVLDELGSLERSFWGLFGWLNVPYPEPVYLVFRGILLLLVVGWVLVLGRGVWNRWRQEWGITRQGWAGLLLMLWLVVLTISWLRFMRIAPAAQGRYFFPAAPTLAWLIALGLSGYGPLRFWLGGLVAAYLLVLSVVTPFGIIRPAYQPPPTNQGQDGTQLAAAPLMPVDATLGERFAITGVTAEPDTLLPGDRAVVTVAWQALATEDDTTPQLVGGPDYSVYVHLVDRDGLVVAQQDTMPGGGLYPTSQWWTGETRVEKYVVQIPRDAYTPNRGHWEVGLYDVVGMAGGTAGGMRLPVQVAPDAGHESSRVTANASGDGIRFGEVTLETPAGALPNPLDVAFAGNVTLAGYTLSQRTLRPGDELTVTLYWQARGPIGQSYTTFVHLLSTEYQMFGGHDETPEPETRAWPLGEPVTDSHRFVVPPETPPGRYQLEIGLYTRPDFDRLPLLEADGAEGADRYLLGPLQVVE